MKTNFNNRELCHIWASQSQETGRGSNMYFHGPIIYSYGAHFPIARIVDNQTVLYTSEGYSQTTAKHKNHTWRALGDTYRVFTVPYVIDDSHHDENANYLLNEHKLTHDSALRARDVEFKQNLTTFYAAEALAYCKRFKITGDLLKRAKRAVKKPFSAAELKILTAKRERFAVTQATKEKRREEERAAREMREAAVYLEKWAAGETVTAYYSQFHRLPVRLRIVEDTVETSHGAKVELDDAIRLLGAWQASTVENGVKIGPYTVEDVNPDVIKIGCHKISRTEAERVLAAV